MIRIMVMNGLLISLILIWTSAAKEPSAGYLIKSSTKPPTGPLNYSVSKPMVSLHETNMEILRRKFLCGSELGGVCVNKKKSCPSNLPSEKSPGKPYCSKKKDRCCYPDPTTAAPPTVVPTTTTTSEDVNWSDIRNACIKSNNYKTYQPLALDICKEKCVEEDAINCQSIEYSSAQQMCAISEARSDSDDFIEPCFVDGWVFAEIELNAGPTTGAPTTLAPSNTTINGQTTNPPTTTAPSNTTNNVSSCNLVWNYEEDRPLIMIRETKTIVPPIIDIEISEDPNRIPEGKKLIFACPGENNQFNHVQGTHTKLHGECISHEQFKVCVNNYPEILDLSQLSCSSKMQPSIIKQDNDTSYEKSCEDIGGELYKFGYIYGDYREFKDLDTKFCFREKDQTTLWTSTNIDRIEISPSMRSMDPANFRTARGLAMNTFYSQKSQQETLKEILDKEVTSVWNDKACRNHGGHCVRGGRPCPKHLPHHTSQGEPFCTSFYRCCYSDQCDPSTCTYKGKKGNCSLDYLPGTTGVGSQECKKGCQCYIKNNKTLLQFKHFQERKELSKLLRGHGDEDKCGGGGGECNPECQNGGTCNSNLQCDCAPGWRGESCDIKVTDKCCGCQSLRTGNTSFDPMPRANECSLKWDIKWGFEPLILRNWNTNNAYDNGKVPVVPPVIKDDGTPSDRPDIVPGTDQPELTFACPGVNNILDKFKVNAVVATCNLATFCVNNMIYSLDTFSCKNKITPDVQEVKETGVQEQTKCYNQEGLMWEIVYLVNMVPVKMHIKVCFHQDSMTTVYSSHYITGKQIKARVENNNPPAFRTSKQFKGITISRLYSQKSQQTLFEKKLDRKDLFCEAQDRTTVCLQRGHLAPTADFVTKAEQDASFLYINANPQWNVFNSQGGNWGHLENKIRKYAEDSNKLLQIFTGGFEVLMLETKDKTVSKSMYLSDGEEREILPKKVPVPYGLWKVVYESSPSERAVAFLVINNPFMFSGPYYHYDICGDITWISGIVPSYEHGFIYCFTVHDFKNNFQGIDIPDLGDAEQIPLDEV